MALPFHPRFLVLLSFFVVIISLALSSTVSFVSSSPTQKLDSHRVIQIQNKLSPGKEKARLIKSDGQQRTIMEMMMKDGIGGGGLMNMPNLFNMANIFKLNGTQFSWVPLGSLLFNNNGNIFGG